mgnify:CR=1 FL=1
METASPWRRRKTSTCSTAWPKVALRARRLDLSGAAVRVLAEINLEKILATLTQERPAFCVIDSIQTLYSEQLTSTPGSVLGEVAASVSSSGTSITCTTPADLAAAGTYDITVVAPNEATRPSARSTGPPSDPTMPAT